MHLRFNKGLLRHDDLRNPDRSSDPPAPAEARQGLEKKWGAEVVKAGFCIVPSLLLRAQRRLHLSPTQLAVLLQLCDFWWDEGRKLYPSKEKIAERLGLGPRQVQRIIAGLEKEGLVTRVERRAVHGGKLSNIYDLSGLVKRLKEIAPDFLKVEEETRSRRRAVARPGFRRRAKAPE
jgi:predicted transcriptional regulator